MASYSACWITHPAGAKATQFARDLVASKLVACVNIMPKIVSVYTWKDKVEEDEEALLMVKTRKELVPHLIEWVKKNHEYDVPEVIAADITQGNPAYLQWVSDNTSMSQASSGAAEEKAGAEAGAAGAGAGAAADDAAAAPPPPRAPAPAPAPAALPDGSPPPAPAPPDSGSLSSADKRRIRGLPTEIITDRLFLGPLPKEEHQLALLKDRGVTAILNCQMDPYFPPDPPAAAAVAPGEGRGTAPRAKMHVAIEDEHRAPIDKHFAEACAFMEAAIAGGGCVYVHCETGASRSATFVLYYLMKAWGMSLRDAHEHCISRRWCCMPNDGFWAALCDAEVQLQIKRQKIVGGRIQGETYPLREYQVRNLLGDFGGYGITEAEITEAIDVTGGSSERIRLRLQQRVNALLDGGGN